MPDPVLSIVVPTHQRRDQVLRLLQALGEQSMDPAAFEVVVVADGCSDGTARAVRETRLPYAVRVIEQRQQGQGAARNHGVAESSGSQLIFFDDDVVPDAQFLRSLSRSFAEGADVVLPFVRVAPWVPESLLAREQREWDAEVVAAMAQDRPTMDHIHFIATGMTRACFEAVGGFDGSFTAEGAWGKEDTELGYRLLRGGYRICCRPELVVDSDCVVDPVVALRRARSLGANDVRFARKHPDVAMALIRDGLCRRRIPRTVGALVLRRPQAVRWLAPLRQAVIAAINRGWTGAVLYRLWIGVWTAEWWLGLVEAGGKDLGLQGLRR
ncbi:MAG TPA: glycosyltransferase [Gemmatimonadales bacterium]|jgi:glycosyltransferase involved in cell wall biosynthesis|nr:glycosyltransferase [Gemmatimonadales bacterium]